MSHRIDPLDASLTRLCSLAEQTSVLLREVADVRDALRALTLDPDAEASALDALASEGRRIHSDRLDAKANARAAQEASRALTKAALVHRSTLRLRLDALETLLADSGVDATHDLSQIRRMLRTRTYRFQGLLGAFRNVQFVLDDPSHVAHSQQRGVELRRTLDAIIAEMEAAQRELLATARVRHIACEAAEEQLQALRRALRRIRKIGRVMVLQAAIPPSLMAFLDRRDAEFPEVSRRTSPGGPGSRATSTPASRASEAPQAGSQRPLPPLCLHSEPLCLPAEPLCQAARPLCTHSRGLCKTTDGLCAHTDGLCNTVAAQKRHSPVDDPAGGTP